MTDTSPTPDTIVPLARELLDKGDHSAAYRMIGQYLIANPRPAPRGLHLLRGLAALRKGVQVVALHGFEAELFLHPDHEEARGQRDALLSQMYPTASPQPGERAWETALSPEAIKQFEWASQRYTYRGVPMVKNCFDLALYPLLLQHVRPAMIIEIGTLYGGSAWWMSDLTGNLGLGTAIYTIDPHAMPLTYPPRVTYMTGNGRALEKTLSAEFLAGLARPLLVIEDADHTYETTTAVLSFFHTILRAGEYIVIEDGMSASGPINALREWFAKHANEYEVDTNFCDFFGINVTWCVNGFLRRRSA